MSITAIEEVTEWRNRRHLRASHEKQDRYLQENVVDMKANSFLRDLGITIESIKALIKRDFGQHHPMHIITDSLIKIGTLPNGQKATNINYNQIFHKIKKKAEEQTVEFELDPDIKLD